MAAEVTSPRSQTSRHPYIVITLTIRSAGRSGHHAVFAAWQPIQTFTALSLTRP